MKQYKKMGLAEIKVVTDGGLWADHNMPCAICRKKPAVLQLWDGRFQPCWSCQKDRWKTVQIPKWLKWLFKDR